MRPAAMERFEPSEPSDGDLIESVATGDRDAFDELYKRYARAVLGLALRRLGDRGRAEDAAQEAFVAIWRSARTYDPSRGNGAPWLYAVARNAITDGLRRTPTPVAELEDGPGGDPDPADRAQQSLGGVARPPRTRGASRARATGDRARILGRACPRARWQSGSQSRSGR